VACGEESTLNVIRGAGAIDEDSAVVVQPFAFRHSVIAFHSVAGPTVAIPSLEGDEVRGAHASAAERAVVPQTTRRPYQHVVDVPARKTRE
jgi:hypothetical protein